LEGTLSDTFAYNPLSPTSPLPNLGFGNGIGFHNNSGNGAVTLVYSLTTPLVDGSANNLVVDVYGRNANQDRDNNVDVAFLDASDVVLGQALGQVIPDGAAPVLRVSSAGLVADGSTIAKVRITGNDSDGTPATTNNFTVMEVRAANISSAYTGVAPLVTEVNGAAGDVGQPVVLPSGALLTLSANGAYSYDPNGVFNPSGTPASDSFTFTSQLTGGAPSTGTVTLSIVDADAPVYVDDAWVGLTVGDPITDADSGTAGDQPAVFGTNAFAKVVTALAATSSGGTVVVNAGNYNEVVGLYEGKSLTATGADAAQSVSISALFAPVGTSVFVEGASTLTVGSGVIGGTISGSGTFAKNTAGTLNLQAANPLSGTFALDGGLVVLEGAANLGAGGLLVSSATSLQVNNALTLPNVLTGTATLTKTGAGILTLGASSPAFAGNLTVAASGLRIPFGTTLGGSVQVNAGTNLGGEGTIGGDLTLGTPAGAGAGAVLVADEGTPGALSVSGAVSLNGITTVSGITTTGAAFALVTYRTTLDDQSGAASLATAFYPVQGGRPNTVDNAKTLEITLANPETTVFTATASDNWQIAGPDANWNSTDTFFFNGDNVTFNDTVDPLFSGTVTIVGNPIPGSVTINNDVESYTFVGGTITGTGGLLKTGPGTVVLNNPNTFTGGVVIDGGVLAVIGDQLANRLAGGSTVTINNGGTYEIRSTNPTATAATPINFIVNAGGLVTTTGIASGHSHLGNVALNGGTVTTANDVASYNGENYQLNGTVTVGGSTPSVLGAKDGIALNGSRTFNVGDATGSSAVDLNVTAELEATDVNTGALVKTGTGTMLLANTVNTYPNGTTVNEGSLVIATPTSIPNSGTGVVVAAGAGFGVQAAGFTDEQLLTLVGNVTWDAGGTSKLIIDTQGGNVTVGADLAGLGFEILATGGGSITLTGNVAGVVITNDGATTVILPEGASSIVINSFTEEEGTTPGTRKVTIGFTADGDVDVYASDDLATWAPIATEVSAASSPFVEDNIAGETRRFYVLVTAGSTFPAP
jgi:autotransporter-associated beta strand protein